MFAVVADSTSDTSVEKLQEMGVTVVPLDILFGEDVYVDGFELGPQEFYDKMDAIYPALPKSACPTPGKFEEAFRTAVANGADGIVSMHLSGGVSGTFNSAVVAAQACEDLNVPIHCVDSKATAGVLSMMIEKACAMRDEGKTADECAEVLNKIVAESGFFVAMETVENVLKGGRLTEEGSGAESGLAMKAVLTLKKEDGMVTLVAKPRGLKAQAREVVAIIKNYVAEHPGAQVRFSQANSVDRIDKVKEALDAEGISYSTEEPGWICGLIGVYVGNHSYAINMVPVELL